MGHSWRAPRHGRPFGKLEPALLSLQLRAGESLYLPRGFLHQAVSTDEISIHITIGLLCYTWWDLLQEIVAGAREDSRLREALPAGLAHDTSDAVPMLQTRMSDFKFCLDFGGSR
jgi:lysine-specific demethylase/histidyl-hydroxylase NO66